MPKKRGKSSGFSGKGKGKAKAKSDYMKKKR